MKKRNDENFLNYIPKKVPAYRWDSDDNGLVTIYVENKGLFNRIAQKLFRKPKVSQVHLEEFGSFIWPLIDGNTSIYEIGKTVSERFGEKAEPLYPRLSKYFTMLENCSFVEFTRP